MGSWCCSPWPGVSSDCRSAPRGAISGRGTPRAAPDGAVRRSGRAPAALFVLLVLTLGSAGARGQDGLPAPEAPKKGEACSAASLAAARQHQRQAQAHLRKRRLAEAVEELRAGYHFCVNPILLVNIAQVSEKLGRKLDAARAYQSALDGGLARSKLVSAAKAALIRLEQELLEDHGRLQLTTTPAGATVHLDPPPQGAGAGELTTPLQLWLTPGSYRLGLTMAGHEQVEKTVVIAGGRTDVFQLELPELRKTGELDVEGTSEALVLIDGVVVGRIPLHGHKLPVGKHPLELLLEGMLPYQTEVTIEVGAKVQVNQELKPLDAAGR